MIAVRVGHVDRLEVLAALGDPVDQFLRLLRGQERVDQDRVTVAADERDGVVDPGEVLLAGRHALRRAAALLGQQVPVQCGHVEFFQ